MAGDGTRGDGTGIGNSRPAGPRHQAAADAPTGLASIPVDHRDGVTSDGPRHAQH